MDLNGGLETRVCEKCGRKFKVKLNSTRRFCSRSCANGHILSDETKLKISEGVNRYNKKYGKCATKKCCPICGSEKGKCPRPDICKHYRILKSLIVFGFDISQKGSLNIINEFDRIKLYIKDIYDSHPSEMELKEVYGYNSGLANFHKILKSIGIDIRCQSDARKESLLLGKGHLYTGDTKYVEGIHKTWDNREVYLRSSYEFDYAEILDKQQIKYEVEYFRIKYFDSQENNYRVSIPDFYLPDTNEIVEIKSNYTLDVQNMKDKFAEYERLGYTPRLILEHREVNLFEL